MSFRSRLAIPALAVATILAVIPVSAQMGGTPPPPSAGHGRPMDGKPGDGKPLASPAAEAAVELDGKKLHISYNSPRMRGRVIYGDLVPYGKVWRTGANPATSFTTEADLMIGTLRVPAGSYTLYTLPAKGTWQFIVSKQTGQWGTVYNEGQDLGRVPMMEKTLSAPLENMSISFEDTRGSETQLHIRWASQDEWVTVRAAK